MDYKNFEIKGYELDTFASTEDKLIFKKKDKTYNDYIGSYKTQYHFNSIGDIVRSDNMLPKEIQSFEQNPLFKAKALVRLHNVAYVMNSKRGYIPANFTIEYNPDTEDFDVVNCPDIKTPLPFFKCKMDAEEVIKNKYLHALLTLIFR